MMLSTLLADLAHSNEPFAHTGVEDVGVSGVTPDSRAVRNGFLFAAVPGSVVDGAKFIPGALKAGASAILCTPESLVPDMGGIAVIRSTDPRRILALMAARFYGRGPENIVAVTGTNGKTSVASFTRQIWDHMDIAAASLGTVGLETAGWRKSVKHTTPEPVTLHRLLTSVSDKNISHLAIEASSHGLEQRRMDGIRFKAAGFTNISRDHLDYHKDFEDYFAQKLRLFDTLLPGDGIAVVNADAPEGIKVINIANERGIEVISVGEHGSTLRLISSTPQGFGQKLKIMADGIEHDVLLPLAGTFQASNALVAAGLVMAVGFEAAQVLPHLAKLKGAKGRLELVGTSAKSVPLFVDYAHTPDALATALQALRPFAQGKLAVVFGCGGDRDRGKRPQMGEVAVTNADLVYVTDDNPRSEDASAIRAEILEGAQGAIEIGDRSAAIGAALAELGEGDLLLIAGKGHETGQTIGDKVLPYSDHEAVNSLLEAGA